MESIATTLFSQNYCFDDSRVGLLCFLEALRAVILIFAALETGLKIECLSKASWAEAEDLGLGADLRSLLAPPKGGLADNMEVKEWG